MGVNNIGAAKGKALDRQSSEQGAGTRPEAGAWSRTKSTESASMPKAGLHLPAAGARPLRTHAARVLEPFMKDLAGHVPDPAAVRKAHNHLKAAGYRFIGFHGTSHEAYSDMLSRGLDPSRAGSNSGTSKGVGFYVSHERSYAEDWAEQSTQGDDPQPPRYEVQRKEGDQGIARVLRVYVRDADTLRLGRDVAWGLQPSSGDPNGDKRLAAEDVQQCARNAADLELVISPRAYPRVAILPSIDERWDAANLRGRRANWPSHVD